MLVDLAADGAGRLDVVGVHTQNDERTVLEFALPGLLTPRAPLTPPIAAAGR